MTEPEFWNHVDALAIKLPRHEDLERFRSEGPTAMNKIKLQRAIGKFRAKVDGEVVEDKTLVSLHIRKTKLYTIRAKLSNRLEDAKTDRDRYALSLEIDQTQHVIEEVQQQIRRVEAGQTISRGQNDVEIPATPLQRLKKLQNCRSMRSRARKQLRKLESLPNRRLNENAIIRLRNRIDELNDRIKKLEDYGD